MLLMQNNLNASRKRSFVAAVKNAVRGIRGFFRSERNGRIQAAITTAVLLAGVFLNLSSTEWVLILLCICAVLATEMTNSALEHICNLVHNEYHPLIKQIKDISAGAVLTASVTSVIIGLIIFLPKILAL